MGILQLPSVSVNSIGNWKTCQAIYRQHLINPTVFDRNQRHRKSVATTAAKAGGFSLNSVFKRCETCGGQGAIECPGCKGTGKNKKNGNIFERWKCFECQGFGLKSCPLCGKGGLTPEQRGER